jgi:predicted nucleotidyltransferase
MSLSAEDYERAIAQVACALEPLREDLVSACVFGSAARGDLRIGKSDIDIGVVLRRGTMEDRAAFLEALGVLEQIARGLADCGIPFDGMLWYGEDELRYVPSPWRADFRSAKDSRLLAGASMADLLGDSVPLPPACLREELYVVAFPCAAYLAKDVLTPQEREEIAGYLDFVRKHIPRLACAVAGQPCLLRDAPRILARLLPDLDLSVLDGLEALRNADTVLPGTDEIRRLLKRSLVLIEDLHTRLVARYGPGDRT